MILSDLVEVVNSYRLKVIPFEEELISALKLLNQRLSEELKKQKLPEVKK